MVLYLPLVICFLLLITIIIIIIIIIIRRRRRRRRRRRIYSFNSCRVVTINLFCSDEERKLTVGSGEKKHSAAPPGIKPRVFRFVHGHSRPLSYEATTEAYV